MIYLTKDFTCVIVSVAEVVKAWRITSLLRKFIPITDNRRQEICIVKTRMCMKCL